MGSSQQRIWPILALALLVAGCADPPVDEQAETTDAGPGAVQVPFDHPIRLAAAERCHVVVCDTGGDIDDQGIRVRLESNQSLAHIALTLTSTDELGSDEQAVLVVDCDPLGPSCGVLAEVRGPLPLVIDQPATTPEGAILRVFAYIDRALPDTALFTLENANVAGSFTVLQSARPPPDLVTIAEPFAFQGSTAPCALVVEPTCGYPSGTLLWLGPYDRISGIELVLTWDAVAPVTEELELTVSCESPSPSAPCAGEPAPRIVRGTSPLNLTDLALDYPPASTVEIRVVQSAVDSPVGPLHYPVRQDYRIDGRLLRLEWPDATHQG